MYLKDFAVGMRVRQIIQHGNGLSTVSDFTVDFVNGLTGMIEMTDAGGLVRYAWFVDGVDYPEWTVRVAGGVGAPLTLKCECGGDKTKTPHSDWCPKWNPFK